MAYDVIVIGGGLAGCSAALQLARRKYDVLLLEKSTYPRRKLCGEFLSPEAQSSFRQLGALEDVRTCGAHPIRQALLTAPNGATWRTELPRTALGFSRYRLDHLLCRHARAAGAEVRTNTTARHVQGSLADGFDVTAGGDHLKGRLVIGAYGRRERLDRTLDRSFFQKPSSYVAFNAHYKGPSPAPNGTIELHGVHRGYCGITPIEEGYYNVCWIGRTENLKSADGAPESMLRDLRRQNPVLDTRLQRFTRTSDDFKAVSQIPLRPKRRFADDVCMIGDAAGMIAPLCGDGMAMALQTADLVLPLAADFLDGHRSPKAFREAYQSRWSAAFERRMVLGRWVHWAAFRPFAAAALVHACQLVPPLGRWLIRATRGTSNLPN